MGTSKLPQNLRGVPGDKRKELLALVSQIDRSFGSDPSDQCREEMGRRTVSRTLLGELQSPDHLRERAAGIRWAIGFVKDDWRIRSLGELADQLEEAAVRLGEGTPRAQP